MRLLICLGTLWQLSKVNRSTAATTNTQENISYGSQLSKTCWTVAM